MPANMKKAGKKYMYGGSKKKEYGHGGSKKKVKKIQRSNPELYNEMIRKAKVGGPVYNANGVRVPGMFQSGSEVNEKFLEAIKKKSKKRQGNKGKGDIFAQDGTETETTNPDSYYGNTTESAESGIGGGKESRKEKRRRKKNKRAVKRIIRNINKIRR